MAKIQNIKLSGNRNIYCKTNNIYISAVKKLNWECICLISNFIQTFLLQLSLTTIFCNFSKLH